MARFFIRIDPQNFERQQKIRLISSAWSDNPRKGGPFLKWLDEALDWNRFEYTFVGRVKERFENIEHIQAVPSQELADILRRHDIYISVSLHEPCSNALLEALHAACRHFTVMTAAILNWSRSGDCRLLIKTMYYRS